MFLVESGAVRDPLLSGAETARHSSASAHSTSGTASYAFWRTGAPALVGRSAMPRLPRLPRLGFPQRRTGGNFNPQWEVDFLFLDSPAGAMCLVCGAMVTSVKKFNVERHYKTSHAQAYNHVTGDDRVNLLNVLKEPSQLVQEEEEAEEEQEVKFTPLLDTTLPTPSTSQTDSTSNAFSATKKLKIVNQEDSVDYMPESSMNAQFRDMRYAFSDEDEFTVIGKRFAFQLRAMREDQRLIAEKIISDIMYYGRIGKLSEDCYQYSTPST